MNSQKLPQKTLEDIRLNVKQKLAALWTSFMFLYIYADYFHLYMPGSIKDILAGKVFAFDIAQLFLLIGLASVAIPYATFKLTFQRDSVRSNKKLK